MLDVNVQTFTTFPFMALKTLNVNVNILINNMMLIKETVNLVYVNHFVLIGLVLVDRNLMIIRLFPKINRRNKPKDKLCIIKWEELCHIVPCLMELIGISLGLTNS